MQAILGRGRGTLDSAIRWPTPNQSMVAGYTQDEAKRQAPSSGGHRAGHRGNELLRRVHEAETGQPEGGSSGEDVLPPFPAPMARGTLDGGSHSRAAAKRRGTFPHKHPFPTPTATPYGSSGNGTGNNTASRGRPSLEQMAKLPTPTTRGGKIADAAEIGSVRFPTPTEGDAKSSGSRKLAEAHSGTSLTDFVLEGERIERSRRGSRSRLGRLNPDWVEWLMGWPIGWTALEPLGMDRFREWWQSHAGC